MMAPMSGLSALFDRLFPVRPEPGAALDARALEQAEKVFRPLASWFRTEIAGVENLPPGGALLVTNHGPLGFDSIELVFGVYRKTGRLPRGLTEKTAFRFPALKGLFERLGHVAGTAENAVALLRGGDLVLVYPGGAREALKGSKGRYKLAWEKSKGFVRVALRAQVPIVPIAGIGVDDYFRVVKEPEAVAETLLGKAFAEVLGHSKYVPPLLRGLVGPIPLPAKLTFAIGEPIRLGLPPEAADDAEEVDRIHAEVKERLERQIMTGLIRWGEPVPS
jgi:1-acyl-sn-glycerol-3-phosphate acyltransferase